jgi:LacI family transcriptional regulator
MGIELDRASAIPIAAQLEEQLTWLIATSVIGPGIRLPSIRQLGAALGVHHHTVRQVYQELQGRGLIDVRHGAGATVRPISALRLARPKYSGPMVTLGVLIADYTPFYLPFLRGVEQGAAETHALTVVSATENSQIKAKLEMQQMIAAGVRGIIAASMGKLVEDESGTDADRTTIPVVYCDQPAQAEESIVFDALGAAQQLASHLASHGHRRVTLMTPTLEYPNMAVLYDGFRRAVGAGIIDSVEVLTCAGFDVDDGEDAATAALTSASPPTAIATTADELALGVLSAASALGVSVPDNLALVSYGAIAASAFVDPAITTVALPAEEMGVMAAQRLAIRIDGAPAAGRSVMDTELVVRASCGQHPTEPRSEPRVMHRS